MLREIDLRTAYTASSPLWLESIMNVFFCYIVITDGEERWVRQKSSVTCKPSQRHYFHCPCTSPSRGGASWIHGSTTRQASVFSHIRRQRRQSLLYFLPRGGYGIVPVDQYSRLENAPGIPLFLNICLFIQFIFCIFYVTFWWSVRTYGIIFFIRLFLFILCVYCHSILLKIVLFI